MKISWDWLVGVGTESAGADPVPGLIFLLFEVVKWFGFSFGAKDMAWLALQHDMRQQ